MNKNNDYLSIYARLDFFEDILGTSSNDRAIYSEYIASKAPDAISREEEISAIGVDSVIEKGMTIFPKDDNGNPFLFDYQIKGFFKDTCAALSRLTMKDATGKKQKSPNESGKITAYKKVIDGCIFVFPRKIRIHFKGKIGSCQRPLRAQTPQGERIALANSESIPAPSNIIIKILCLSAEYEAAVLEWLGYGELRGIGQWRNSGMGRFKATIITEKEYNERYQIQ